VYCLYYSGSYFENNNAFSTGGALLLRYAPTTIAEYVMQKILRVICVEGGAHLIIFVILGGVCTSGVIFKSNTAGVYGDAIYKDDYVATTLSTGK